MLAGFARAHFLIGRQVLDSAIQAAGFFQMANKPRLRIDQFFAANTGNRKCLCLEVIVFQYELADLVGHLGEESATVFFSEFARIDDRTNQNLDIDLMI